MESNTLTVSGANTYSWNTGATTSSIVITPSLITTLNYSITGTSSVGCTNTTVIQMKVNACTGIDQINNLAQYLTVYPNPNNGSFVINFEKDIKIKIVNELGQLVQTIDAKETINNTTSIQNLASGIYFVIAERNNQVYSQKNSGTIIIRTTF